MKHQFFIIILFFSLSSACLAQSDSSGRVWPPPPDQARIKHLLTISSLQSFETQKGFFSGMFSFLFGGERTAQWLVQPLGIAVSASGTLYITDPGASGVHIINQVEKEYQFLSETDYGKFRSPIGCAIAEDGTVFISDSERGDIIALDEDYDEIFRITANLVRPTGMCIKNGRLYVVDTGQHKVLVYSLKGEFLMEFGKRGEGTGEFNYPVHLAVDDSIIVIDALNYRIQKFDSNGIFASAFGKLGNVAGRFASPKGVALDSDGNVYVTDVLMDNIQIFNKSNQLLLVLGKKGSADGEFMTPSGIAVDREDKIYVVDSLNRRIQIFQYLK